MHFECTGLVHHVSRNQSHSVVDKGIAGRLPGILVEVLFRVNRTSCTDNPSRNNETKAVVAAHGKNSAIAILRNVYYAIIQGNFDQWFQGQPKLCKSSGKYLRTSSIARVTSIERELMFDFGHPLIHCCLAAATRRRVGGQGIHHCNHLVRRWHDAASSADFLFPPVDVESGNNVL
jgi:hypothetical protein